MPQEPVKRDDASSPLPPLTQEQYWRAIEIFMVELNHLLLAAEDGDLQSLPAFSSAIADYLADLRDTSSDARQALYAAFGYVDEYCHANQVAVIAAAHKAYLIARAQSGG